MKWTCNIYVSHALNCRLKCKVDLILAVRMLLNLEAKKDLKISGLNFSTFLSLRLKGSLPTIMPCVPLFLFFRKIKRK